MKIEKEFPVPRGRDEIVTALQDDGVLGKLFPDTRIERPSEEVRETFTRYTALGKEHELHLIFRAEDSGDLRFEKDCSRGTIWRSLDGSIELESLEAKVTNVRISMQGKTRALVPERAILGTMKNQLDQMADSLQATLSEA